jgi:hypothetical protein
MSYNMQQDERKKHRVIGIRHTLKSFKQDGLVDDDTMYPDEAVEEVKDEMLKVAQKWYRIGAKRGALETLEAFLDGKFEVQKAQGGGVEIIANADHITWERSLTVHIGNDRKRISKKKYRISIKELGFEST